MRFYSREAGVNLSRTYQFLLFRVLVGLALSAGLVLTLVAAVWLWLALDVVAAAVAIVALFLLGKTGTWRDAFLP